MQSVLRLVPDDAARSVDHLGRDLVAAVGGQAVHEDRVVRRVAHQLVVHAVAGEGVEPRLLLVLLAHRHPRVGDDDVRSGDRRDRVGHDEDRAARLGGTTLGVDDDPAVRAERRRSGHAHVHARRRAGEQVGVRHVAGTVADEGDGLPGQGPAVLADGEQVGEELAGMEVVGQRVDDGDPCAGGHLLEPGLRVGAPDDRRHHALEHAGGVGRGLLAAELAVRRRDDERAAAEVGDADVEGHPGTGRRLVEDHRDGLRSGEGLLAPAVGLHLRGEVEDRGLLGLGEVVVAEEVAGHAEVSWVGVPCSAATAARLSPRIDTNSSISSSDTMSGGAMRRLDSFGALMMRPRPRAAALTAGPTGAVSPTPTSRPVPRTSCTSGDPRPAMPARMRSPFVTAPATRSARSISSRTAFATRVPSGLPPNVEPCCPAENSSDAQPNVTSAPIGKPPAMPFAIVTASGVKPCPWNVNQLPVRPTPVWISSRTNSAPCSSVSRRAVCRKPSGRSTTPASPLIGSTMSAATVSSIAASSASTVESMCSTPGTIGRKSSCSAGLPVSASAPIVRPWKPCLSARMRVLRPSAPLFRRASLKAASFASAPELPKYTRPAAPAPVMRLSRSASSSCGGVAK
ncbi:Uncharacterized protein Cus16_0834 [Curtobacterium sp. ER1/6]|nr:Uncharacterized protein Cus16_0834 [Curtobacterium sp. ER1/6]